MLNDPKVHQAQRLPNDLAGLSLPAYAKGYPKPPPATRAPPKLHVVPPEAQTPPFAQRASAVESTAQDMHSCICLEAVVLRASWTHRFSHLPTPAFQRRAESTARAPCAPRAPRAARRPHARPSAPPGAVQRSGRRRRGPACGRCRSEFVGR